MKRSIVLINFFLSPLCAFAQVSSGPGPGQVLTNGEASQSPLAKCLPSDVKLSDVVEVENAGYARGQSAGLHKVTVEQKLSELKATCNGDNKLIDGNGKKIIFYHLTGCWGNPPFDYQEILQRQRDEINRLRQQNTVIEITCNPSAAPIS